MVPAENYTWKKIFNTNIAHPQAFIYSDPVTMVNVFGLLGIRTQHLKGNGDLY